MIKGKDTEIEVQLYLKVLVVTWVRFMWSHMVTDLTAVGHFQGPITSGWICDLQDIMVVKETKTWLKEWLTENKKWFLSIKNFMVYSKWVIFKNGRPKVRLNQIRSNPNTWSLSLIGTFYIFEFKMKSSMSSILRHGSRLKGWWSVTKVCGMVGFKANAEITGNFRIFEKFLCDRVLNQKWCLPTKFHLIKRF